MSSALEGLAAYKARKEAEEARRDAASKPKVNRANLEKDGDSFTFRFAQEIDFDATNYDPELGIGFVNIEHTCGADPKNGWRNRANCSLDSQGDCYPCNRVKDYSVEWADRKGWKQKEKFYINVIAGEQVEVKDKFNGKDRTRYFPSDLGKGEDTVYLLEQGTYNGIWDQLAEAAVENETILDTLWKVSRKGSGFNDTSYTLTQLPKKTTDGLKDLKEYELYNIKEDVLVEIPYAQQEAFYYRGVDGASVVEAPSEPRESATAGAGTAAGTEEAW